MTSRIERLTDEERDLVAANMRLVRWALKRNHPPPGMDFEDLVGVGNIGLMVAARKFDVDRGYQFSTFAIHCIRNEVRNHVRHLNRKRRGGSGTDTGEVRLAVDASFDRLRDDLGFDPPVVEDGIPHIVESMLVADVLRRAADLDPRLPSIIADRMAGATLQDAGNRHGLTSERVRQLLLIARTLDLVSDAPAMEVA